MFQMIVTRLQGTAYHARGIQRTARNEVCGRTPMDGVANVETGILRTLLKTGCWLVPGHQRNSLGFPGPELVPT